MEAIYEKKSHREHVLLRPDTYVGSIEPETISIYVPTETETMILKNITFVPAFYKIFDEILVNAADNRARDVSTTIIKVSISDNFIEIENNGKGIPVVIHETEKIYIPELIFGHFLTGSNFNDSEKKITGGRNGYGAKLTNVFSKEFTVDTFDSSREKRYKQKWTNNMEICGKAQITSKKNGKDYTKISFIPDFEKLRIDSFTIDSDTMDILKKRVYDLAGTLDGVKVYFNGKLLKINSFKDYISHYTDNFIYEKFNDRWELAISLSDSGSFKQVSFVNNIATLKGGKHVTYITDQIVSSITDVIKKKDKKNEILLKPAYIKNQLSLFINCVIENPTFDSQIKDNLTLPVSKFGSTCKLSDAFIKKLCKMGIIESVSNLLQGKDERDLKKTDGQKKINISGIPQLDDANDAGTKRSKDCTLFLVEGLSAKGFAVTGIPVLKNGKDLYGVFPLKGKMLNVRDASMKQKLENLEIKHLKQILGLQEGKIYSSVDSLRYGHVCILADADVDASHIKGLVINFFDSCYPSLLKIPGFLLDFKTPIVKCNYRGTEKTFYDLSHFEKWKGEQSNSNDWNIKYYKGLGTSKPVETREYFKNISTHMKRYRELDSMDSENLDKVFSKKRVSDRKKWLQDYSLYDESEQPVTLHEEQSISNFINQELIQFSMYDNVRSIPSIMDGLKPGQRKIMFTTFKINLTKNEMKVAQLANKTAEMTSYHHGENSLAETIVGMAQDFVGSNNINLLLPQGGFGTRMQGGKDAASSRYIFTKLNSITRLIFRPEDDPILTYNNDEGKSIEPQFYVPIIPMILVNGCTGIGSGYSTTILSYNPKDLVNILLDKIHGNDNNADVDLLPWYKDYIGSIDRDSDSSDHYIFTGKWSINNELLTISELPIHVWTENYKINVLEKLIEQGVIKNGFKDYNSDIKVSFQMKITDVDSIVDKFKLSSTKTTSNMMLFNSKGFLQKYQNTREIIDEFYEIRLYYYQLRKDYQLKMLHDKMEGLKMKLKFLNLVVNSTIIINKRKKEDLILDLIKYEFSTETHNQLLNIPVFHFTLEKINELTGECLTLENEYQNLFGMSSSQLYENDLRELLKNI